MSEKKKYKKGTFIALGIAIGLPLGFPIAMAMDMIALGPALGLPLGIAIGIILEQRMNKDAEEPSKEERRRSLRFGVSVLILGVLILAALILRKYLG